MFKPAIGTYLVVPQQKHSLSRCLYLLPHRTELAATTMAGKLKSVYVGGHGHS